MNFMNKLTMNNKQKNQFKFKINKPIDLQLKNSNNRISNMSNLSLLRNETKKKLALFTKKPNNNHLNNSSKFALTPTTKEATLITKDRKSMNVGISKFPTISINNSSLPNNKLLMNKV